MNIHGRLHRCIATLVAASAFLAVTASTGYGRAASPNPDPDKLSRLRAAQTPGAEALLAGTSVTVGKAHPDRVFLPVAVFDMGRGRPVTVREITVTGPGGAVLATERPGRRLMPVSDGTKTKVDVLARIADRDQGIAVGVMRHGLTAFENGIHVASLALADGTTTTFTVRATLDVAGQKTALELPLTVTVAALPSVVNWHSGDGHAHSSTWSDGLYSLDSQASRARNDGQKFVIMTDHWSGIWARSNRGNANWARYHDDCSAQQTRHGIPVLPGVEVMSASRQGHALGYALSRATVPPRDEYWSPSELIARSNAHTPGTSYAAIAHPYQGWPNTPWSDWTATGFRAMELMSNERMASASTQGTWFALLRAGIPGVIGGGRFVVGMANTDDHFNNPGGNGMNWIRSTALPLTRTAVWDAVRLGRVSASGRKDLGYFTLNGAQQGSVVIASSTTRLTFSITQKPVTGRRCTGISIRDKNNAVVWSVVNPISTTYTRSIAAPPSGTFYVVKMDFAKADGSDSSHVWCNPVFVDRR